MRLTWIRFLKQKDVQSFRCHIIMSLEKKQLRLFWMHDAITLVPKRCIPFVLCISSFALIIKSSNVRMQRSVHQHINSRILNEKRGIGLPVFQFAWPGGERETHPELIYSLAVENILIIDALRPFDSADTRLKSRCEVLWEERELTLLTDHMLLP